MKTTLLLALALALPLAAAAQDWTVYRGPGHDGKAPGAKFKSAWTDEPAILWRAELGIGFSSFTIQDGRVFSSGWADNKDTVFCLDAATGKDVWKYSYPQKLGNKFYEGGSSATPTLAGSHVYHLSRDGAVYCLDIKTGKELWKNAVAGDNSLAAPEWGFAGSPVIIDGVLVVNVGSAGAGLDPASGKTLWKSDGSRLAGYSTPLPMEQGGKAAAALATGKSYAAVEAKTGKVLWDFPWETSYDINAADPIPVGQNLFISSGYNHGGALLAFDKGQPKALWENKALRSQFNSSILHDGHLYGIDGDAGRGASLKCVEAATGKEKWQEKSIGFGSLILAGNQLLVLSEKGMLHSAPATPEKFAPTGSAQILGGRCWATPTLSGGIVYARNAKGATVAVDLREK